jgi:hypothetical protein
VCKVCACMSVCKRFARFFLCVKMRQHVYACVHVCVCVGMCLCVCVRMCLCECAGACCV